MRTTKHFFYSKKNSILATLMNAVKTNNLDAATEIFRENSYEQLNQKELAKIIATIPRKQDITDPMRSDPHFTPFALEYEELGQMLLWMQDRSEHQANYGITRSH